MKMFARLSSHPKIKPAMLVILTFLAVGLLVLLTLLRIWSPGKPQPFLAIPGVHAKGKGQPVAGQDQLRRQRHVG